MENSVVSTMGVLLSVNAGAAIRWIIGEALRDGRESCDFSNFFFFCWKNESGLRFILSIVVYGVW